ncbi:MAG TPA: tail fiber domain-containing protein [Parapedobacter sp.]|uniref:tail fiber domain-containing protein n=1 Tax=Parapedobacter sp. TaxID=1958893 RepID=UPI002BA99DBE|nr:tail fiber domain-containing protein [Parapedobacter sp.]HWK59494.1 tail fiber domain-containing protein [Parapedobacter sp.]
MMKQLLLAFLCAITLQAAAQVGIGTNAPQAGLHVVDSSVVFSAEGAATPSTTVPVSGEGRRMMWYAEKAAFRVGYLDATGANYWDAANIGNYSFAAGKNARAQGASSFAAGSGVTATGKESVALGLNSTASADRSFAANGTASGVGAVAIGVNAQATNDDALALGKSSLAEGLASIAIGAESRARGSFGVAIGTQSFASGNFSVAIGRGAHTDNRQGSIVLADGSFSGEDYVYATANNQITMRFIGGYQLYTNQNLSAGVALAPGAGAWSSLSDRNRKENFEPIDTESILRKVTAIPVSRWNYKSQPNTQQHIGPMAQDFHAAFRLDGLTNDTTINTVDIDGVNMAAIQALEKRTAELKAENEDLKSQLQAAKERLALLEAWMARMEETPEP